ncbi:MAG: hypothetical protein E3J83_02810 [Candidatus Atribacteria bacterium]|nr:MAG: hypothetical protein E3J83_02810 [Candidatus Atribacteria bacterium]
MFNNTLLFNKDIDIHLTEKVRVEEKSIIALENFFFQSKAYIERLKSGQMSFEELVEKYDWKKEQFKEVM